MHYLHTKPLPKYCSGPPIQQKYGYHDAAYCVYRYLQQVLRPHYRKTISPWRTTPCIRQQTTNDSPILLSRLSTLPPNPTPARMPYRTSTFHPSSLRTCSSTTIPTYYPIGLHHALIAHNRNLPILLVATAPPKKGQPTRSLVRGQASEYDHTRQKSKSRPMRAEKRAEADLAKLKGTQLPSCFL